MDIKTLLLAMSVGLMSTATAAIAAEEGAPAQPPQTHDIRAAELPPVPGLYYSVAYGQRQITAITDDNGDPIFPDTAVVQRIFGMSGLYVMPNKVGEGTLGFYGVATFQNVNGNPGGPFPAVDNTGDFVDLVVGAVWSRAYYRMPDGPPMGPPPGFVYALGLQATIPGGSGSLGSFVLSPNVAVTYRTDPILLDGTEFSARLSYNLVSERDSRIFPGTRYKDGDYLSIDFALTERYRNFQFGLAGTYMKAMEDDKAGPGYPIPAQGRMEELALGGVINVDLGPTSAVRMRYTRAVRAKNMSEGNLFGIQYVRKF